MKVFFLHMTCVFPFNGLLNLLNMEIKVTFDVVFSLFKFLWLSFSRVPALKSDKRFQLILRSLRGLRSTEPM